MGPSLATPSHSIILLARQISIFSTKLLQRELLFYDLLLIQDLCILTDFNPVDQRNSMSEKVCEYLEKTECLTKSVVDAPMLQTCNITILVLVCFIICPYH